MGLREEHQCGGRGHERKHHKQGVAATRGGPQATRSSNFKRFRAYSQKGKGVTMRYRPPNGRPPPRPRGKGKGSKGGGRGRGGKGRGKGRNAPSVKTRSIHDYDLADFEGGYWEIEDDDEAEDIECMNLMKIDASFLSSDRDQGSQDEDSEYGDDPLRNLDLHRIVMEGLDGEYDEGLVLRRVEQLVAASQGAPKGDDGIGLNRVG